MLENEEEVLGLFKSLGAILTDGHFVFTGGKHGSEYVNKDAVYPHPMEISALCHALAERFAGNNVETVIAPAIGGALLSQWTAHHLTALLGREVHGVYAEKEKTEGGDTRFVIKRGYDAFVAGKRVLVLEDVINSGGSVKKVVEVTRETGGEVVGVGALCNRGDITARDIGDVPKLLSLLCVPLRTYDEAGCPMCKNNIPVNTNIGKGREFLAGKKK